MKRKLISFDAFKKIEEQSFTRTESELIQAEDVLAKTLGVSELKLHSFGESDVTYQTDDGNFVHAVYNIDNEKVILENIEFLVIEQESEKKHSRQIISKMLDSILENNENKATQLFESYMSTPSVKQRAFVKILNVAESPVSSFEIIRFLVSTEFLPEIV